MRSREEVELSPEPNETGYKTHRVPSLDFDPLTLCKTKLDHWFGRFEVIKPKPQKIKLWEIPVFSIGTFTESKIMHELAATTPKLDAPKT